jgi:hypothetical protein
VSLALFHQQFWAGAPVPLPALVGIDPRRVRKAKPRAAAAPVYVDVAAASAPALRASLEYVLTLAPGPEGQPTVKRRRPGITDEEMEAALLALLLTDEL